MEKCEKCGKRFIEKGKWYKPARIIENWKVKNEEEIKTRKLCDNCYMRLDKKAQQEWVFLLEKIT